DVTDEVAVVLEREPPPPTPGSAARPPVIPPGVGLRGPAATARIHPADAAVTRPIRPGVTHRRIRARSPPRAHACTGLDPRERAGTTVVSGVFAMISAPPSGPVRGSPRRAPGPWAPRRDPPSPTPSSPVEVLCAPAGRTTRRGRR